MPHRKNAKGDIGTAKKFSDSYDMDNIYLSEEGWVYRHFKNSERSLWWDEILVAGQVIPDQEVNGVTNGAGAETGTPGQKVVIETNPLKLGTASPVPFQKGDDVNDYRYSDHIGAPDKVVPTATEKEDRVAWDGINVSDPADGTPDGWEAPGSPDNGTGAPEYDTSAVKETQYTIPQNPLPDPVVVGEFESGAGGGTADPVPEI